MAEEWATAVVAGPHKQKHQGVTADLQRIGPRPKSRAEAYERFNTADHQQ
jgi:hypothetical protein